MPDTKDSVAAEAGQAPQHPRGYTMADEEMERLSSKRDSEDVLDPIALDDPVGMSVERLIARAAVVVVFVLVVGLLFAQVACKNIQRWGIPTFEGGVTETTLQKALDAGISWSGEIVRFPDAESVGLSLGTGAVDVVVADTSHRTFEQLVEASQDQAFVLAMTLMANGSINRVAYTVESTVDEQTGAFSARAPKDSLGPVLTIVWNRTDAGTFACEVAGFDPAATKSKE